MSSRLVAAGGKPSELVGGEVDGGRTRLPIGPKSVWVRSMGNPAPGIPNLLSLIFTCSLSGVSLTLNPGPSAVTFECFSLISNRRALVRGR